MLLPHRALNEAMIKGSLNTRLAAAAMFSQLLAIPGSPVSGNSQSCNGPQLAAAISWPLKDCKTQPDPSFPLRCGRS